MHLPQLLVNAPAALIPAVAVTRSESGQQLRRQLVRKVQLVELFLVLHQLQPGITLSQWHTLLCAPNAH